MRFRQFVEEMAWKLGSDNDFPGGKSNIILFFKPDEIYRKEGQVHGLFSHAIKHIAEFKPDIKRSVMNVFNTIIQSVKNIYINKKPTHHREFGFETILNTLDAINDKIESHKELLPIEQELFEKLIKPMSDMYDQFATNFISTAIQITPKMTEDEIKSLVFNQKKTISFPCKYHDLARTMFVNYSQGVLLTMTKDKKFACTLYKTQPEKLRQNILKQDIPNEKIKKAFF